MAERVEVEAFLQQLLQPEGFKDYGPNGLQVEGRREVQRLASGVTASLAFIDAAIAAGADTLLVHHGLFWRGQDGRLTGWLKARVARLLAHDLNLFAYHLPLDAHAEFGNNAQLGRRLGLVADARFGEQDLGFIGPATAALQTLDALAAAVGVQLGRDAILVPGDGRPLRRIAWCTGGAQGYFEDAVAAGADAFLTGEIDLRAAGPPGARDRGRLPGLRPPCDRALWRAGGGRGIGGASWPGAPLHRDREPGMRTRQRACARLRAACRTRARRAAA